MNISKIKDGDDTFIVFEETEYEMKCETWHWKMYKVINGIRTQVGLTVESTVRICGQRTERDTQIKKLFVTAGMLESTNAKEKTELLDQIKFELCNRGNE